ncbi:uncharacterized protein LOC119838563 [Zerene cesonia]|uniref:uncharacterized protein LOC119838563 n=1 Tax=Zerene cesonia TaxID=33412 RepID=UPI0018E53B93|nr:uncharacterized protein LOC119838563 [Zerene cesonia]
MKVQIVLLSLVLLVRAEPNVYCGRQLAMALAMVCGYDEKRDTGAWMLDRSQTGPYVRTEPWLGGTAAGAGVGSWLALDTPAKHKARIDVGAWLAQPAQDKTDKNVGPWLALETQASHKEPWLAPHTARTVSRSKRQIVMECCLKACSEDELLSYC